MNLLTSQEVFAGPYLEDAAVRAKFGEKFLDMTNGFLALPICLPGTTVWKGKQGRLYIISVLKEAAAKSKANAKVWLTATCIPAHELGLQELALVFTGDQDDQNIPMSKRNVLKHLPGLLMLAMVKIGSFNQRFVATCQTLYGLQCFLLLQITKCSHGLLSCCSLQAGAEPACLMDFWAHKCLEEIAEAAATGRQPAKHTTDLGMADTIMDFLFASQDASTASLVWMMNLMADCPDILEKAGLFMVRQRF